MHLLNLKSSDGYDVAIPVRLPDAITFDCFVPGRGILSASVHPTSLDPSEAAVGDVDVWRECGTINVHLTPQQDDAAVEQAGDVLAYVVDRLTGPNITGLYPGSEGRRCPVLRSIADLAHHEACAWEAWEALPEAVRWHMPLWERPVNPRSPYPEGTSPLTPSARALAAYVEVLVGEAQEAATKAAKKRQDDWEQEQREERAAAARAARTDSAINAHKDGL